MPAAVKKVQLSNREGFGLFSPPEENVVRLPPGHGARIIGIPYAITVQLIFPSRCESSLDLKCFEELINPFAPHIECITPLRIYPDI